MWVPWWSYFILRVYVPLSCGWFLAIVESCRCFAVLCGSDVDGALSAAWRIGGPLLLVANRNSEQWLKFLCSSPRIKWECLQLWKSICRTFLFSIIIESLPLLLLPPFVSSNSVSFFFPIYQVLDPTVIVRHETAIIGYIDKVLCKHHKENDSFLCPLVSVTCIIIDLNVPLCKNFPPKRSVTTCSLVEHYRHFGRIWFHSILLFLLKANI
jgi:hypothetical protein